MPANYSNENICVSENQAGDNDYIHSAYSSSYYFWIGIVKSDQEGCHNQFKETKNSSDQCGAKKANLHYLFNSFSFPGGEILTGECLCRLMEGVHSHIYEVLYAGRRAGSSHNGWPVGVNSALNNCI